MKFSIIIPVYNCKESLRECVNSILTQNTDYDYEILLVDDGSSDGSGELCDSLSKESDCVKSFHKKNGGASSARNYGLKKAQAEYVVFLDSDDLLDERYFEVIEHCLFSMHELIIFGVYFEYFSADKLFRKELLSCFYSGEYNIASICDDFEKMFMNNCFSPVWNKVFRLEIVRRNNIQFDEQMVLYEDLDFSIRYLHYCQNVLFLKDTIYHYRIVNEKNNYLNRVKNDVTVMYMINKLYQSFRLLSDDNGYIFQVLRVEQSIISQVIFLSLYNCVFHRNQFDSRLLFFKKSSAIRRCIDESSKNSIILSKVINISINKHPFICWIWYVYKNAKMGLVSFLKKLKRYEG